MRKEIMMLGLVGLIGCDELRPKSDVSQVEENVILTKPADCEELKDLRYRTINYDHVPGQTIEYQVKCLDKEGNVSLYVRTDTSDSWRKITVK